MRFRSEIEIYIKDPHHSGGMSSDMEIKEFLTKAKEKDPVLGEITLTLRNLGRTNHPEAIEVIKYGGICLFDAGLLVGGFFQSKKHISVEFSEGANLEDPDGFLEGTGKFRRHLKIRTIDDIEGKKVAYYLKQAFHE